MLILLKSLLVLASIQTVQGATPPNILFVLADDFGWNDLGFRNSEIDSPHLDELAKSGIILNRHYVFKYCSPTRSSFLSGRLPLHVNVVNRPTHANGGVDLRMTMISEKLKQAKYATHVAGKWHGGGYAYGQLPTQRGFDSHLGYLNGEEDHWTQRFNQMKGVDLWLDDMPAFGMNGTYGGLMYVDHMVKAVEAHATSDPLFLYMPFQNTHAPYEVPDRWLNKTKAAHPEWSKDKPEMVAMVAFLDEGVKNVTDALKAKKDPSNPGATLWDNTIVIFSADNGGEQAGAGNNWPLRGGKYTDFEGGTRVAAFVSGGKSAPIPANLRGTTSDALVHICDWWATLSALAGVSAVDDKASSTTVPPPDSVDVWQSILTNGTAAGRVEVPLSAATLVGGNLKATLPGGGKIEDGRFKLVTGEKAGGKNKWVDTEWPMGKAESGFACSPCLFDLYTDVEERTNLATSSKYAPILAELQARLSAIKATAYQSGNDGYKGAFTNCTSETKGFYAATDFIGPVCYPCLTPPCTPPGPSPGPGPGPSPGPGPCADCVEIAHTDAAMSGETLCITSSGSKKAPVTSSSCSNASVVWKVDKKTGTIAFNGGAFCLRPKNPPTVPAACMTGQPLMVGENACMKLDQTSGQITCPACPGLCAVVASGIAQLGACNSSAASGWSGEK